MATFSQIRDFEFVASRCYKDITVTAGAPNPTITTNTEWERVSATNGTVYWFDLTNNTPPTTTAPTATGILVPCEFDVEQLFLCDDTLADGTTLVSFVRVAVYSNEGVLLWKADYEEDLTTDYTVSAEANVKNCSSNETSITLTPSGGIATNGAPVTVPINARSFTVTNLGLNAEGLSFSDITIAGVTGLATIPAVVDTFSHSVEEDQDGFVAAVVITPAAGHSALVQWNA